MSQVKQRLTTFLTFAGNAEDAMNYYAATFADGQILELTRFGKDNHGEEGKVLNGLLSIKGQQLMFMDLPKDHAPQLSWAVSLFVECAGEEEFDALFDKLSADGVVMMGPEAMPQYNIKKATWVTDKFGVTWQLVWQ